MSVSNGGGENSIEQRVMDWERGNNEWEKREEWVFREIEKWIFLGNVNLPWLNNKIGDGLLLLTF